MPKIHGLAYIAVGLFVSLLSLKLDYEKLFLFFYAGLAFVFIGIMKLIFNLVKSKSNKKEMPHHQAQTHKYCPKCGNALRLNDRFCNRCGARIGQ